ncbi:hypothetical protein JHK87_024624 [Glycine soja]|nr:hypothetical protein JHK87_024624 [Glycine soja]
MMKLGVRELCVVKCGFSIVVSQEGRQNTYRIKTLNQYHKCGTMFSNKNAKTSWVAKHFLERLKCNPKMSVTNVIDDMRIRFAIKITTFVVTKARKLTLDIVSGHAKKQYLKLRDYFKELISACKSNTCEIMIDISNPTIEPRPATIPLGASIDSATPPNGLATATQIARATGRIIEKPRMARLTKSNNNK